MRGKPNTKVAPDKAIDILDEAGAYRLEVALDPAAAAARGGAADDEALRRASAALDRDDAERQDGVSDPDDDVGQLLTVGPDVLDRSRSHQPGNPRQRLDAGPPLDH